jgi:hypothetical protein
VLSLDAVEAFLGADLGWLYHYNYERVHSGYGMAGRTPYGCCVALGFEGSAYVGLMPVVLLDDIVLDWSRHGVPAVNDVLTHYTRGQGVADKGTTAWHGISAAGAVFPSASVNGQARCIALTPFVPLSREAGEAEVCHFEQA